MFTALKAFKPTSESIPPPNNALKLKLPTSNLPVHYHPLNPLDFLLRAALIYPNKLAIAHPDHGHFTYEAQRAQRVLNLAYALLKAGLRTGDRIAVIAPNVPMMAVGKDALQAAPAARVIATAINTRLTHQEVAYILEHSGSKLILIDSEYTHLIKGTNIPFVISNDTGKSDDPYEQFLSEGRRFGAEKGWLGLEMEADENAPAFLCYTSGTTGRPKGVLTTLRGTYLAAIANAYEGQMNRGSTYLWILPMFHAAGWTFPWANTFAFTTQITMRSVDYPLIWKHFLNSGITHYCGAPTVQIGIVNDPSARRPPQVIKAYIAGAAPTAHLIGSLEKIGITPIHVYGLTETYGPFTRSYPQDSWSSISLEERTKLMARQGHSFATASETRVVYRPQDTEGLSGELIDVPKDGKTMGEIVTRGNIVMKEYFNDQEATNKAFRGGYFGSGDLAVMYPDGSVAIMDRSKDIIISGERVEFGYRTGNLLHIPMFWKSLSSLVNTRNGESVPWHLYFAPSACLQMEGRHEDFAKDLKVHARKRLPGFACPEWVEVVTELPKTSTGKILKNELRKVVAKL